MIDAYGVEMEVGQGYRNLRVKNVLKMRNDIKIIFLTERKAKIQVILPYRYFGYGDFIKVGELYNLVRCADFNDIEDVAVENYQLTSIDGKKNFNLYY